MVAMSMNPANGSTPSPSGCPSSSAYARRRFATSRSLSGSAAYSPRSVFRAASNGVQPRRVRLLGDLGHEPHVPLGLVEGGRVGHRPVPRYDGLGAQLAQQRQRPQGTAQRPHQEERRPALEDQVPREQHPPVRQPYDGVADGVRDAGVDDLGLDVADVERHTVVVRQVRALDVDVPEVGLRPQQMEVLPAGEGLAAAGRVRDEGGGRREEAVAVGVVPVVVGVDQETGPGTPVASSAAPRARVRRSVAAVSTSKVVVPSLTKPELFRHHPPSGCTYAYTSLASSTVYGSSAVIVTPSSPRIVANWWSEPASRRRSGGIRGVRKRCE